MARALVPAVSRLIATLFVPISKSLRQPASSLDWVIVRAAMLTNDPARGSVRAVTDLAGVKGGKIGRADVARFVMEQLNTWLRRAPVLLWRRVQKALV